MNILEKAIEATHIELPAGIMLEITQVDCDARMVYATICDVRNRKVCYTLDSLELSRLEIKFLRMEVL